MSGERVASAAISPHLCTLSYIQMHYYLPLQQLHFSFGDFSNRVCHFLKIFVVESSLDMGLLIQQTVCSSPKVLASANMMMIMTVSVGSHWWDQ